MIIRVNSTTTISAPKNFAKLNDEYIFPSRYRVIFSQAPRFIRERSDDISIANNFYHIKNIGNLIRSRDFYKLFPAHYIGFASLNELQEVKEKVFTREDSLFKKIEKAFAKKEIPRRRWALNGLDLFEEVEKKVPHDKKDLPLFSLFLGGNRYLLGKLAVNINNILKAYEDLEV